MTRPETHNDLPKHRTEGHLVADIPAAHITTYPSLGMHLLAAIAEADHLGLIRDGCEIRIPLTTDELDAALRSEQRTWDYAKKNYATVMAGQPVEKWIEYTITNWAKEEGLPLPAFADPQGAS